MLILRKSDDQVEGGIGVKLEETYVEDHVCGSSKASAGLLQGRVEVDSVKGHNSVRKQCSKWKFISLCSRRKD